VSQKFPAGSLHCLDRFSHIGIDYSSFQSRYIGDLVGDFFNRESSGIAIESADGTSTVIAFVILISYGHFMIPSVPSRMS
jgi:hypothetical protein